jgi:two-component system, chemotaxis family, chemotaxis protein CheY
MRILIVDDDFVSRTKLEALLSEYGDCDAAEDGQQAIDMFEQAHDQSAGYDLITMDIDMPGMSGHEVLSRIREWEETHEVYKQGQNARVLMSTSMQSRTDIMSSFRAGCEGYLKKPITPEKLTEALASIDIHGCGQVADSSMEA